MISLTPITQSTTAPAHPAGPAPMWPSPAWNTWLPTRDRHLEANPTDFMQAAPHAPHANSVAQADFAFGGNYMAHGNLDVFAGWMLGSYASAPEAIAAAQSLKGAHGIVGVFAQDRSFAIRELLVEGTSSRGPGDDIRDGNDPTIARPRATNLKRLEDVGERKGSWGHGDFRTLSALRFVDSSLVAFVRGKDQITRMGG